jgi:hypothetical protein
MAKTCGYVCPLCEGLGFDKETLEACAFCNLNEPKKHLPTKEEWIEQVHEGSCCSDREEDGL